MRIGYRPPPGFYDLPFSWIFDGSGLTDGGNALNQQVYIEGGLGDFLLRRVAGLGSVVAPSAGKFQIRRASAEFLESEPVFASAIGKDDLPVIPEEKYPETSNIRFDLYDVLRDPPPPSITQSPVQIDTSPLQSGFPGAPTSTYCGPFLHGSTEYAILSEENLGITPPVPGKISVFKRPAGTTAWTILDTSNSPTFTSANTVFNTFWDPIAGVITFTYLVETAPFETLRWGTFDTTIEKFVGVGTIYPDITDTEPAPVSFDFVKRSDGSIVLFYTNNANHLVYRVNTAGVWSAATAATPQTALHHYHSQNAILDPATDTTHLIYFDFGGGSDTFRWVTVSNAGGGNALGAVAPITNELLAGGDVMFRGWLWNGNTLVLPVVRTFNAGANVKVSVFVGTPLAGPVWTVTDLEVAPGTTVINNAAVLPVGTTIYAVWNRKGGITIPPYQIGMSINTGLGWSVPNTFYDALLFPPLPDGNPVGQFIQDVALVVNASGGLDAMATMTDASRNFVAFGLVSGVSKVISAQLAFQGVRRQKAPEPKVIQDYKYTPKSFTYTQQVTLTVAGPSQSPSIRLFQMIDDYDFDLLQVILTYKSAASLPAVVTLVQLYDYAKRFTSNIPMLDIFLNGASGSEYGNGAIVPPLSYPQETQIQLDIYSAASASILPVTITVHFVGIQRYPCA